jgi:hypothetical protein
MYSWLISPLFLTIALATAIGCQKKSDNEAAVGIGHTVSGVVLEKLDADPDSYLRLQTGDGEAWAKIPLTGLVIGTNVNVVQAQEVRQWESPKLQRTFDRLYLGRLDFQVQAVPQGTALTSSVIHQGGHQGMTQQMPQAMGHPGQADAAVIPKIDKAPGADGRTVADIVANALSLQGKTVSVRGQVVRATTGLRVPNVAGGTWIHIQDGSGDPAAGTHNLTAATDEAAKVGDILLLRGSIKIDDSGMLGGRVIVQGAKIVNR